MPFAIDTLCVEDVVAATDTGVDEKNESVAAAGGAIRLLFVGDICSDLGLEAVKAWLPRIRAEQGVDVCVANAENSAPRGVGLSKRAVETLLSCGVDVITLGNHAWSDRDIFRLMDEGRRVVRPANHPPENPGSGSIVAETAKGRVGVVNIVGQVFMEPADCPFRALDRELAALGSLGASGGGLAAIVVDMHAEATAEKAALAYHADGRVSCVIGTHTHVQTADERVLEGGAAFISDAGMTGPLDGVIGVDRAAAMRKFRLRIPTPFLPARGRRQLCAVAVDIEPGTGKAVGIRRIKMQSE
jgi:metallophosphoesterase (TIGR00282 family)